MIRTKQLDGYTDLDQSQIIKLILASQLETLSMVLSAIAGDTMGLVSLAYHTDRLDTSAV